MTLGIMSENSNDDGGSGDVPNPKNSADCHKSQPGMPRPASVIGSGDAAKYWLLRPIATAATLVGGLTMVARATCPTMGRAARFGTKLRLGLPQPAP